MGRELKRIRRRLSWVGGGGGVLQLVLALLGILAMGVRGDTVIEALIEEEITTQCFAMADAVVQMDFGVWSMQLHQLETLQLPVPNANTTNIRCHFVWLGNGDANQWFDVFLSTGLGLPCAEMCHWSVTPTGFYLRNPTSANDSLQKQWIAGPDNWTAPN